MTLKKIILALAIVAAAATASFANPPGGSYIYSDPGSKTAPVRNVPDGW